MLAELSVENLALIDRLNLCLAPGFDVLTGETGAGKSLIVGAIGALLGDKVDLAVMGRGDLPLRIEGIFQLDGERNAKLESLLSNHGLDGDEGGLLILSREVKPGGRSVARINQRAVPLSLLKAVGHLLVDIHSQAEHFSLLDPEQHLDLLDAYAGLGALCSEMAAKYAELSFVERELSKLEREERLMRRDRELLNFQVEEIEAANLKPGEEEELQKQRAILLNREKLSESCESAYQILYGAEAGSVFDLMQRVKDELKGIAALEGDFKDSVETVENAIYNIEDLSRALHSYAQTLEYEPKYLEEVEQRLNSISHLKRKYGNSIGEILAFARDAKAKLSGMGAEDEEREQLRKKFSQLQLDTGYVANKLSVARCEAGIRLVEAIKRELAELNMSEVDFAVSAKQRESDDGLPLPDGKSYVFNPTGIDVVEFLVSTNKGEALKPLAKIASGGETSRFMLALSCALQARSPVSTLIFDEIDIGIGGRSGDIVGKKLAMLARSHQVLCITHLPQIACLADAHYKVSKEVEDGCTHIGVQRLDKAEDRAMEITDMLGKVELSPEAVAVV